MATDGGSRRNRGLYLFGLIGLIVVAAVLVVGWTATGAKLEGDTPQERIACLVQLADERPRGAADVIAQAAAGDGDSSVRQTALTLLGRFIAPKYRSVVEAAARDADAGVRAAAAATLGLCGDAAAADRLGELVAKDPQQSVRLAAVVGLGRCQAPKAVVLLVETMEKHPDPAVQARARTAAMDRIKMSRRDTRPQDLAMWRNDVELVKALPAVAAAYKAASYPLERHPEFIIPEHGETAAQQSVPLSAPAPAKAKEKSP